MWNPRLTALDYDRCPGRAGRALGGQTAVSQAPDTCTVSQGYLTLTACPGRCWANSLPNMELLGSVETDLATQEGVSRVRNMPGGRA